MADTKKIGARIVLEGEQEFNQSLRNSKTSLKEFDSELKLAQAQFKNNEKSMESLQKVQQAYVKQQQQLQKQEKTYVDQIQKATTVYNDAKKQHEETAKSVEELKKKLADAEKEYGKNSDEVEKLNKELEKSESQYEKEEKAIAGLEGKMSKWQTGLNDTRTALSNVEKNIKDTTDELDDFGKEVEDAGDASAKANPQMEKLGVGMGKLITADLIADGIRKLASSVVDLAKASFDVGSQFEASMSQVAATMGITTEEIANGSEAFTKLNDAAKASGQSTMFSASQSASALNFLALAGYDADKAIATLPKVLDLAAAGGMELGYASDLVTDSMAALGMETDQLNMYIDQMARTSQKSNTSVSQLGEATLVAAGAVAQVNMPLDAMNAALGVLANNGIKGAEGGTHLRNAILSLAAPTDKAEAKLKALGVTVTDSNGDMRDFQDILEDLNYALADLGDADRAAAIKTIFNKTDISAVNALLKSTNGEFEDLRGKISDCDGAAAEMASTMNDNLKGKLTILQSAMEGLGIEAYEIFDEDLKTAVEGATVAVGKLTQSVQNGDLGVSLSRISDALEDVIYDMAEWAEEHLPKIIEGLAGILENSDKIIASLKGVVAGFVAFKGVQAIGSAVKTIQQLKFALDTAKESQLLLNVAANANPYALVAGVVVGVGTAVLNWAKNNKSLEEEWREEAERMTESYRQVNEEVKKNAEKTGDFLDSISAERAYVDDLTVELDKLNQKERLTKEEKERVAGIVAELNKQYEGLNLQIDETTGKLDDNTGAWKLNLIEMQKASTVASIQKELDDATGNLTKAQLNQYQIQQKINKIYEEHGAEIEELTALYDENTVANQANLDRRNELEDAIGEEVAQLNALEDELENANVAVQEASAAHEELNTFLDETIGSYDKEEEALAGIAEQAKETAGELRVMSEDFVKHSEELRQSVEQTLKSSNDIFSETKKIESQNIDEMRKNVDDHINQINDWKESYTKLADRVGDESGLVLEHLANLGVEGKGYIDELLKLDDEQLAEFTAQMTEALTLPDTVSQEIVDSYTKAVQESIDGMRDMATEAGQANSELRHAEEAMADSLNEALKEKWGDDGKKIKEETDKAMTAVKQAIDDAGPDAKLSSEQLAEVVDASIRLGMDYETFKKYGGYVGDGLADGIAAKEGRVRDAINRLTEATKKAATANLDIHSPSKVFKQYGEFVGEGFKIGLEDSMGDVIDTVNALMPNDKNIEVSQFQNISMSANTAGNGMLARIDGLLTEYLPVLSQMKVVLDTGATVGGLAPAMNKALGVISTREGMR